MSVTKTKLALAITALALGLAASAAALPEAPTATDAVRSWMAGALAGAQADKETSALLGTNPRALWHRLENIDDSPSNEVLAAWQGEHGVALSFGARDGAAIRTLGFLALPEARGAELTIFDATGDGRPEVKLSYEVRPSQGQITRRFRLLSLVDGAFIERFRGYDSHEHHQGRLCHNSETHEFGYHDRDGDGRNEIEERIVHLEHEADGAHAVIEISRRVTTRRYELRGDRYELADESAARPDFDTQVALLRHFLDSNRARNAEALLRALALETPAGEDAALPARREEIRRLEALVAARLDPRQAPRVSGR